MVKRWHLPLTCSFRCTRRKIYAITLSQHLAKNGKRKENKSPRTFHESQNVSSCHNKQQLPVCPHTSLRASGWRQSHAFSIHNKQHNNHTDTQLAQTNPGGQFTFRRAAFLTQLHSKVGLALVKVEVLRININLDGAPIASKSHTHPSHSQTSRLLTSSLSLGVPVPRPTQCVRGA
jgi:hypothetical protein